MLEESESELLEPDVVPSVVDVGSGSDEPEVADVADELVAAELVTLVCPVLPTDVAVTSVPLEASPVEPAAGVAGSSPQPDSAKATSPSQNLTRTTLVLTIAPILRPRRVATGAHASRRL